MDKAVQEGMARLRELRTAYMAAHKAGMAALERRDLDALNEAILTESEILREQQTLIARLRRRPRGKSAVKSTTRRSPRSSRVRRRCECFSARDP